MQHRQLCRQLFFVWKLEISLDKLWLLLSKQNDTFNNEHSFFYFLVLFARMQNAYVFLRASVLMGRRTVQAEGWRHSHVTICSRDWNPERWLVSLLRWHWRCRQREWVHGFLRRVFHVKKNTLMMKREAERFVGVVPYRRCYRQWYWGDHWYTAAANVVCRP